MGFAGEGFGAAALGAAGLGGGWGLGGFPGGRERRIRGFGVVSGIWVVSGLRGGFAIWSGGCEVVGFGQFCQAVFSLVQRVVSRLGELFGGCAAGEGGGFEPGGGEAVLAQQGDHGAAVLAVEPHDVVGGDLADQRCGALVFQLGVLEQRFERVFGGQQAESLGDEFEPLEGVLVGEGLGDLGEGVAEELEVGVDGGVGDLEDVGDLAEGVSALVEFLGVEDALASF